MIESKIEQQNQVGRFAMSKMMTTTKMMALAGAVAALVAGPFGSPPAGAAEVTLRFATYVNQVDVRYKGFKNFADLVQEKTGGRVAIQIFDSGTLHPFSKAIDSVLGGVSDISPMAGGAVDTRLPCARITHLTPTPVDWERHVELDQEYNALLKDEFAKLGLVVVLSSNFSYDQEWWFRKPIAKLDQLNGMLIRDIGPVMSHIIKKWGGKPVFISPKEVFQSSERGVVDGINMGVATFSSWKLWTVMPHMINANLFYGNVMYAMNKKKFDTLSAADQKAILEAGVESARQLKPDYEAWIDQQVGNAIMKGGGSARALAKDERLRLIKSASAGWSDQMDEACGPELAGKLRALFAKYEG